MLCTNSPECCAEWPLDFIVYRGRVGYLTIISSNLLILISQLSSSYLLHGHTHTRIYPLTPHTLTFMLFKLSSALKKKFAQSKPTPSALLLAEILERVFDFIDDDTIHDTIILVCRLWFSINQRRLFRELTWNDSSQTKSAWCLDEFIWRLPRATCLKWTTRYNDLISPDARKIFQALERINSSKDQSSITNNGGLRVADLIGSVPFILKALPYLPFITVLRLCIMQNNSIDMDYIFQTCPRLQSLQLDSPSTLYLPGCWGGSSNNNNTVSSIPPLQSLYLENACFSQSSLESMLLATPHMKHLQLRNLRRQDSREGYSWHSLYKCLVSLALSLQSIHFSVFGQQPVDDAQEAHEKVLSICPHATEWSFRTSDLTLILRQSLQKLPNVVTTLNLVTESVKQPNKALALHQYLCESPHLLHLKASQSYCLIERMDLFGRWMPLPIYGEDAYRQPGIWMCRQLQTLHIEVHKLHPADRQGSPTRSRVLFGYISRVCPNLRDLEVWEPENVPGLCLELPGGFCLLARLRLLENFRIGSGKNSQILKPRDVKWLTKSGRSATSKQERREGMNGWSQAIVRERQRVNDLWERVSREKAPTFVPPQEVEPELVQDLKNLGLLEDVRLMLHQMNSSVGYDSLPRLRSLSVYSDGETGLSPEKEYRRMNVIAPSNDMITYSGWGL